MQANIILVLKLLLLLQVQCIMGRLKARTNGIPYGFACLIQIFAIEL